MARSSCAATVPTLTLWDGLRAVRFKLWDERHERLVTFGEARQRVPAVPAPGRHPSGGSSTWAPESEVVSRAERRAVAVPACFRLWAGSPSGRCRGVEQASRDRNGDSRDSDGRPPTRVGRCHRRGPALGRAGPVIAPRRGGVACGATPRPAPVRLRRCAGARHRSARCAGCRARAQATVPRPLRRGRRSRRG